MNGDLLHNAAELYKAGNKQGAAELLERYLQKNPDDADAWYGLALCATDPVETRTYLIKTLEVNPEHPKAHQALEKLGLTSEEFSEPAAPKTIPEAHENEYEDYEVEQSQGTSHSVVFPMLTSLVVLLLIGAVIWLWYRLDKVEKSLIQAENQITSLDSELSYVASLAQNANLYAHSHPYSDSRLKENVEQIQDPATKLAQLQGVYFNWTEVAQDRFGLSADTEIGLIAQQVAQVFPEVVTQDENGYMMVDYSRLVPVLIEAIKSQQIEINGLREILLRLEGFDG